MKAPLRTTLLLPFASLLVPALCHAQTDPALALNLGGGVVITLVHVPAGTFTQGSPASEPGRKDDELQREVTITRPFYMSRAPITVGQWKRFVDASGFRTEAEKGTSGGFGWDGKALVQKPEFTWKSTGFSQTENDPVTIVTYDDTLAFTRWASGVSGRTVTLPTEAQWEYAYRAGTKTASYAGDASEVIATGWFKENAGTGTKPVGMKRPNNWGLVDMGGNVWQWCLDWYAPYTPGAAIDPIQMTPDVSDKARRVLRGGSWLKESRNGRAAARFRSTPGSRNADYGFRVVVLDGPSLRNAGPNSTPTNPDAPTAPSGPSAPPSSGGGSSFAPILAILMAPILFFAAVFGAFKLAKGGGRGGLSKNGVTLRPGKDGFWIDASPAHVGARVTAQYRAMGAERVTHATIEHAPQGQFVYTGYEPDALRLVEVVAAAPPYRTGAAQSGPSWGSRGSPNYGSPNNPPPRYGSPSYDYSASSSSNESWSSSSSSSSDDSFRGYPSAY